MRLCAVLAVLLALPLAAHADEPASEDPGKTAGATINAGTRHLQAGAMEKAEATLREGVAQAKAAGHKQYEGRGRAMLGQTLYMRKKHEEAAKQLEAARVLLAEVGDDRGAAVAMITLAKLHVGQDAHGKAAQALEHGLAAAERSKFEAAIMQAVDWLAWTYHLLEDYERAKPHFERALELHRAAGRKAQVADAYVNLANVYWELGEYAEACATADGGSAWAAENDNDRLPADMTMVRAYCAVSSGETREGLRRFKEALALFQATDRRDRMPPAMRGMAGALARMGNAGGARRHLQRALELAASLGQDDEIAAISIDLAGAYYSLGSFGEALDTIDSALSTAKRSKVRRHVAAAVAAQGTFQWALGDFDAALASHRDAASKWRVIGDRRREAIALGNISSVLVELGDLSEALDVQQSALALARSAGSIDHEAFSLTHVAAILSLQNRNEEALKYAHEALAAAEKTNAPELALSARAGLGNILLRAGKRDEGLRHLTEAADEAHSWRLPMREVEFRQTLARAYVNTGDFDKALQEARAGSREVEEILGSLGDVEGSTARARFADLLEAGAEAAARLEDPRTTLRFLEKGRASLLLASNSARAHVGYDELPQSLREAEQRARGAIAHARSDLDRLGARGTLQQRREKRKALDAAVEELRAVAGRIEREAKRQARIAYPRAAELRTVQGTLDSNQAIVVYGLCGKQALAVVVTPDAERVLFLDERTKVERVCRDLVLSDPEVDAKAALAAVESLLVKPLDLPASIKSVVVSPDGELSRIPFALLFGGRTTVMTPSATTYSHLVEEAPFPGAKVLALGDPAYELTNGGSAAGVFTRSVDGDGITRSHKLVRLPATRPEVEAVGDVVLLGREATESAFAEQLGAEKRWRAVHFACHGLLNMERADLSSLAVTRPAEVAEGGPLTQDGFLTATEIMRLRIPTDLAVLSACETGRGKVMRGNGLLGLTRSFLYAGAQRVVCSLWKVDDEATGALMKKFYELWNPKDAASKGMAAIEALRRAQAFVRRHEKWKHPYYWAGWVLWGLSK